MIVSTTIFYKKKSLWVESFELIKKVTIEWYAMCTRFVHIFDRMINSLFHFHCVASNGNLKINDKSWLNAYENSSEQCRWYVQSTNGKLWLAVETERKSTGHIFYMLISLGRNIFEALKFDAQLDVFESATRLVYDGLKNSSLWNVNFYFIVLLFNFIFVSLGLQ